MTTSGSMVTTSMLMLISPTDASIAYQSALATTPLVLLRIFGALVRLPSFLSTIITILLILLILFMA